MKYIKKYNENTTGVLSNEEFVNIFQELLDLDIPNLKMKSTPSKINHIITIENISSLSMSEMGDMYQCLNSCDMRMPSIYTKIYNVDYDRGSIDLYLEYYIKN